MTQHDEVEAWKTYREVKHALEAELARCQIEAVIAPDPWERRNYRCAARLARKALEGLAKQTPMEYAERLLETTERIKRFNSQQRTLRIQRPWQSET